MTTKKLLIAFDSRKPDQQSSDFLFVVLEGTEPKLFGTKSKRLAEAGLMVYVGKDIKANDLFAKLVDSGRRIESVDETLRTLESYIQKLQDFRIGNLLAVEPDTAANSGFKLVKLAESPPTRSASKFP